jgi:DNA-binding response OmpR family regulator
MALKEKTDALVLETDQKIIETLSKILKRRSYAVTVSSQKEDALGHLKDNLYPLAIVGDTEDGLSPFEAMRDIVMTSPMTSIILITDLPEEEVNEKAEGYGILGHVNRDIASGHLLKLIKTFEEIFKPFAPANS